MGTTNPPSHGEWAVSTPATAGVSVAAPGRAIGLDDTASETYVSSPTKMYVDHIALYKARGPLPYPMGPLANSSLHQPYLPQGSGYDWLLSSPAHDKRVSHPGGRLDQRFSHFQVLLHGGHLMMMLLFSFPYFKSQKRFMILPAMPIWSRPAPEVIVLFEVTPALQLGMA